MVGVQRRRGWSGVSVQGSERWQKGALDWQKVSTGQEEGDVVGKACLQLGQRLQGSKVS